MRSDMQDQHDNVEPETAHQARGADYAPLILDDETIAAFRDLRDALDAIHCRLISEGYVIQKGRYVAPDDQ